MSILDAIPIPVLNSPPEEIRSWTGWLTGAISGSGGSVAVSTATDQPVVIVAVGSGMALVMWLFWPAVENLRTKIDQWSAEKLRIDPHATKDRKED